MPQDVDYIPVGVAPLRKNIEFYEGGTCPKCGGKAHREVDVMDTFVSSAWYMYRYFDPQNNEEPFTLEKIKDWFPMDWYQGAQEHYTAHLVYARFIAMFLYDIGYLNVEEPIKKYVSCGLVVAKDGGKFSKRLANAPDLDIEVKKYGADTLRMFVQFVAPFQENSPWDTSVILGITRVLNRIYRIASENVDGKRHKVRIDTKVKYNKVIDQVKRSFIDLNWNVAISRIMDLVTDIKKDKFVDISIWKDFIKILAPFITEELWEMSGEKSSVHLQKYPRRIKLNNESVNIVVAVDGKKRAELKVKANEARSKVVTKAMQKVHNYGINDTSRYTYVKGRIINFILK